MKTAREIIETERSKGIQKRRAVNSKGNAIAGWDDANNRWVMVAGLLLDGTWANFSEELLINNKPLTPQSDWLEV